MAPLHVATLTVQGELPIIFNIFRVMMKRGHDEEEPCFHSWCRDRVETLDAKYSQVALF